jgi:thiamine pyrophosphokinase
MQPLVVSPTEREGPMQVVIVASGELAEGDAAWLDTADEVIAADGGVTVLDRIGQRPDRIVGDVDSADPSLVERLAAAGTGVERHAPDKEASDTELAVTAAVDGGATTIVILGATGGARLDHELANLLLLADPALADVEVTIARGPTVVRAVHGGREVRLRGGEGDLVTLLPVGDVHGVTTAGLHWPLDGATLRVGRSRGLSNVVERTPASVSLESGTLLVVETANEGETS